jgi:carotenoid cleavage dioxygenase-like enzyme
MYTSGPKRGKYDIIELSSSDKSTEFPTINNEFSAFPYCYYYAIEWFHDSKSYGSMAVAKHSLCDDESKNPSQTVNTFSNSSIYWSKDNFYPSEATFIPSDKSESEDDGVLVFTVLDGNDGGSSYFEIVDARTMLTIQEIELSTRMTFSVHGQFYENMVP